MPYGGHKFPDRCNRESHRSLFASHTEPVPYFAKHGWRQYSRAFHFQIVIERSPDRLYRKKVYLVGDAVASAPTTQPAPVRRDPTRQDPTYREPQPLNRGPSLEQQLGGGGQRPVLGRVGQLLDGLVAPASGTTPLAPQVPIGDETIILREQVSLLQQELAALRARLSAVEKQLQQTRSNQ